MTRTPPTVAVLIQAHPSRAARAAALQAQIGGTIIYDPDPTGQRSAWRCYRRCLESIPSDATHACVIQEDCIPVVDRLPELLPRLASPTQVSSLFIAAVPVRSARLVHQASDMGECWASMDRRDWVPAICLVWPRHLAERFLAWVDAKPNIKQRADDGIIGAWLKANPDVPPARVSIPNLVEHPDDVPSIASHSRRPPSAGRNLRRVSTCLPVAGCDLHAVDWEAG